MILSFIYYCIIFIAVFSFLYLCRGLFQLAKSVFSTPPLPFNVTNKEIMYYGLSLSYLVSLLINYLL